MLSLKLNFASIQGSFAGFLKARLGLIILIVFLVFITIGTLKPDFFLLGWDNFSSYLNPQSNIFNTFFATWREHRGLGVPSDAEVNDVFRQVFSLVASVFVGRELVDQLYIILMLWGGVLGMYALGRYISRYLGQSETLQETFGFVAGFFYLFNLSTLAVFYFPMIMYVTRFFMLPTTVLILLHLLNDKSISWQKYLAYVAILFIGFGSFMVPTIFIVFMMMLGFGVILTKKRLRILPIFLFYLGLGMFWILPFTNYTIQKGSVVPQAPLFIDINEALLNKPKSYYSFERQAKLRPGFFESEFTNNQSDSEEFFHPLSRYDEKGITSLILWIFPALYLLGMVYIFLFKRDRVLLWFSITTLFFLMLSMKEYSPVGFLYGFVTDHVPYANTIFRFGDTKFHAMVGFGGSILAAVLITKLLSTPRGKFIYPLLYGTIFLQIAVYINYFNGNLIGFFMYNKIPQAYFDLANVINKDSELIRVVQLPFDSRSYWKPYSWGYFGSSFLHFMLNKPLFDRTFEPASMETAQIHAQMMDIVNLSSSVSSDELLRARALDFYNLLSGLSIKYVIDDGTISTHIASRNVTYWGKISPADSRRLLSVLEKEGYIRLVKEYSVTPSDYSKYYAELYPYNQSVSPDASVVRTIRLYALNTVSPRVRLISETDVVHSSQTSILSPHIRTLLGRDYIQSDKYDDQSIVFPFNTLPNDMVITDKNLDFALPVTLKKGEYVFEGSTATGESNVSMANAYIQKVENSIRVYIQSPIFPNVVSTFDQSQNDFQMFDLEVERDDYSHLRVGDAVFSIPKSLGNDVLLVGSVLVRGESIPISLIYPETQYNVSKSLTQLEQNPRCLGDAMADAASEITGDLGVLRISGQNVSNCLTTEIRLDPSQALETITYAELEFVASGDNKSIFVDKKTVDTGKPVLKEYMQKLEGPVTLDVCIKSLDSTICLNKKTLFTLSEQKKRYTLSLYGDFTGVEKLAITFTVRSKQPQSYTSETTDILLKLYKQGSLVSYSPLNSGILKNTYLVRQDTGLKINVPLPNSPNTRILDLGYDGIPNSLDPNCNDPDKIQSMGKNSTGILLYSVGCKNILSTTVPFSSDNYYLWNVSYKHLSGGIPAMVLMDKIHTYSYKKLLPPTEVDANSYFSIPLQKPESVFSNKETISRKVTEAPEYTLSGFIEPASYLQDTSDKDFILEHYSQNESLIKLRSMSLIELPSYLSQSKLYPKEYRPIQYNDQANITSFSRLLPSLWKVDVSTEKKGEYLVLFNEHFDTQWVVINIPTILHSRCNSYANCYLVDLKEGSTTFYIFYLPELLSALGFIASSTSIVGGLLYIRKQGGGKIH